MRPFLLMGSKAGTRCVPGTAAISQGMSELKSYVVFCARSESPEHLLACGSRRCLGCGSGWVHQGRLSNHEWPQGLPSAPSFP